jgi:hypothetical protein
MLRKEASLDWESDKSSSTCTICMTKFGRLIQRRHHCRSCGRLVCAQCSSNRAKIDSPISPSKSEDNMQRVCDPCFQILNAKEEKLANETKQKDRKLDLLWITSYLSDCLVDIFFLDGQFKTICFDETMTIGEIAIMLFPTVKIAFFEVHQDMFDSQQYQYLPETKTIASIVSKWREMKKKYAKLIFPIYDSKMIKNNIKSLFKRSNNNHHTYHNYSNNSHLLNPTMIASSEMIDKSTNHEETIQLLQVIIIITIIHT